jgi:2-methylisocitrate lyase-like PEP mutase family enzyme
MRQYPGNMDEVRAIVRAVAPKPVNLGVGTIAGTLRSADVQATGVKRLSLGAALYLRVMGNLAESAKDLRAGDLITASAPSSSTGLSFGELHQAMSKAIGD